MQTLTKVSHTCLRHVKFAIVFVILSILSIMMVLFVPACLWVALSPLDSPVSHVILLIYIPTFYAIFAVALTYFVVGIFAIALKEVGLPWCFDCLELIHSKLEFTGESDLNDNLERSTESKDPVVPLSVDNQNFSPELTTTNDDIKSYMWGRFHQTYTNFCSLFSSNNVNQRNNIYVPLLHHDDDACKLSSRSVDHNNFTTASNFHSTGHTELV